MPSEGKALTRDQKAENLVVNYSMIMMGIFEGVFAALASKMSEAMVAGATAMSEALGAGEPPGGGAKPDFEAEVSDNVREMFSKMRRGVADQMSASGDSFRKYLKDPRFDEGIKIVERYDLGVPKLTSPLRDEDIVAYMTLIEKQEAKTGQMFRELSEWQKSMPKLPKNESSE